MAIFFSSDYHLGHTNVLGYCNRPFKNIDDMCLSIIREHNQRVRLNDTLYHLGDFCFRGGNNSHRRAREWEIELNGNNRYVYIGIY